MATTTLSPTLQSAASGAMLAGSVGLLYGYAQAPKSHKEAEAVHYGLLLGSIGAVVAILMQKTGA